MSWWKAVWWLADTEKILAEKLCSGNQRILVKVINGAHNCRVGKPLNDENLSWKIWSLLTSTMRRALARSSGILIQIS